MKNPPPHRDRAAELEEAVSAITRYTGCTRSQAWRAREKLRSWSGLCNHFVPESASWDKQSALIDNQRYRRFILSKSRGTGFSWVLGRKGVGKACARPRYERVYVSLNKADAQRKLGYAKEIYYRMASEIPLPGIESESKTELRFTNGSVLHAMAYPRGPHGCDIDLDEFAHMQNARAIFTAANPIMAHGGQLTIGSSVTSATSLFNEIYTNEGGNYSGFSRDEWYWWDSPLFCRDVATARLVAPTMDTEQRVRQFGKRGLRDTFTSMLLEDFQMEMEGRLSDESDALLAWNLILSCAPSGDSAVEDFEENFDALAAHLEGRYCFAGLDIGRRKDTTELSVLCMPETGTVLPEHMQVRLDNAPFEMQQEMVAQYMGIPNSHLAIDETGLGMQLAEWAEMTYGGDRVRRVNFSANIETGGAMMEAEAPAKQVLATSLKMYMQRKGVRFQTGSDRNYQMHSVKRHVTREGRLQYLVDEGKAAVVGGAKRSHHADVFWARAMACWMHAVMVGIMDAPLIYV